MSKKLALIMLVLFLAMATTAFVNIPVKRPPQQAALVTLIETCSLTKCVYTATVDYVGGGGMSLYLGEAEPAAEAAMCLLHRGGVDCR